MKHTLNNAINLMKKQENFEGTKEIKTAIMFYADDNNMYINTVGDPRNVLIALGYIKEVFVDDVAKHIVKNYGFTEDDLIVKDEKNEAKAENNVS